MKSQFTWATRIVVCSALSFLGIFIPCLVHGAGVTVITHGLNSSVTGWVTDMANEIPLYSRFPGTNYTLYELYFVPNGSGYDLTWERLGGSPPSKTDSGEIIVAFDWSQLSDGNSYNTYQIAPVLEAALLDTNFISEMNGHALAELPIHLIGHSRGGSLMCQACLLLGTNGLWVDHLTTLDPHPLNNDGFTLDAFLYSAVDAPCHTYQNILFHDNYWENLNFFIHGESVAGAYIRKLVNLSGGYENTGDEFYQHSNTHLWYYGTINLNTPTDNSASAITETQRTNWWVTYEDEGTNSGFLYSLIGGGDRLSMDHPLGLPSDPAIRDGYNQDWDLGAGTDTNRTLLPSNNGTWPNLIKFDVTGASTVTTGSLIYTAFYYQYAGASNLTVQIYYDEDSNPYDTNNTLVFQSQIPGTGAGFVNEYSNLGLPTTNIPPGTYAIFGKITDGLHVRYLYAPQLVQIISSQQPVLDIGKLDPGRFRIGINGIPGQQLVLQVSSDLQTWLSVATNTLTGSRWIYTNSLPANQQFYRTILQ